MTKISACIISFNEERKIEACLQSLVPVADEIVIVDSLSTDRTLEIARQYTERIFKQTFLGHIEQKNLAVSKASHDWILSLDCDERLSGELTESLLQVKQRIDQYDAYSMPRRTFYIYRWLNYCWYPDRKIRLFNRNTARWGGTNPHDRVETDGTHIKRLSGDILHYSFDSISDHLKTIDKFTEIGADELIKKNKRVGVLTPISHATWHLIKLYIIKRGFLDGFAGLVVSVLSYMHVFTKYAKARIKIRQAHDSR